jgi:ribosomal-protein-alanine N-acetyltransferase
MTGMGHFVTVRGDAACLARIHARCFEDWWDASAFNTLLAAPGVRGDGVRLAPSGAAIAFGLARVAADEAEILTLAVLPEHRRRGLGLGILTRLSLACAAAGAKTLMLEAGVDNPAALGLYRSAGFLPVGLRKAYYARPAGLADALILKLQLPP